MQQSQNYAKSLAREILIQGESEDRFSLLFATLVEEFHPDGPFEMSILETMVVNRWRQMRLWTMEQAGLKNQLGDQEETTQSRLVEAFTDQSKNIDLMHRCEARLDRQYNRSLGCLLHFQALKRKKMF